MPLSGLNRSSRPRGGVAGVELIPASEYAGGAPSASSARAFREDRARYSEERTGGPLVPLVRHTLVMELAATPEGRRAVDVLAAVCRTEGVVAVVTTASGEVLEAGYSARFAALYPLRLTGMEYCSGNTPADFPTITLTLESVY